MTTLASRYGNIANSDFERLIETIPLVPPLSPTARGHPRMMSGRLRASSYTRSTSPRRRSLSTSKRNSPRIARRYSERSIELRATL
jgi:hypothetical protein